jgi:hypothetical protein
MVGLLEKYASNLEGLVAQRTRELADEKERADRLLYQMLPKYVHVVPFLYRFDLFLYTHALYTLCFTILFSSECSICSEL